MTDELTGEPTGEGRLTYTTICSLDGFIADPQGDVGWAEPSEPAMAAINEHMASLRTLVHGRRTYELMTVWETDPDFAADSPESLRYAALWRQAEKVVVSRTLEQVATRRTRIERDLSPDVVRRVTLAGDAAIDGPTLAASALREGWVDEVGLYVVPVVVGGGLRAFPMDVRLDLALRSERRFADGMVHLRYDVRRSS